MDELALSDLINDVREGRCTIEEAISHLRRSPTLGLGFASLADDLIPGRDDGAESLERNEQLSFFSWREEHVVSGVARRLKRGVDSGPEPFEVFILAQDHVVAAARAHTDRIILDAFVAAIDRCKDRKIGRVLNQLCDLYAPSNIERDRGWFQEHGRVSSTRSKAITRRVNGLCAELRVHAGLLVDAFGIPDAVLAAPIGVRSSRVGSRRRTGH